MKRPFEFEHRLIDNAFNAVFGVGGNCNPISGEETECPQCGKRVKVVGLGNHIRDKHSEKERDAA